MERIKQQIEQKTLYLNRYFTQLEKAHAELQRQPDNFLLHQRVEALEQTVQITVDSINKLRDQLHEFQK